MSTTQSTEPATPTADATQAVPLLLRLLTHEARIPLSTALKIAAPLRTAGHTPASLASAKPPDIQPLVAAALEHVNSNSKSSDVDVAKLARQISSAAKRVAKASSSTSSPSNTSSSSTTSKKRKRTDPSSNPEDLLPEPLTDEPAIRAHPALHTNRAPLLLAFALVHLGHSMPSQPLDSRLSIAQGMVSAGARARARSLGIPGRGAGGKDAEDAAGEGFRRVSCMGGFVAVLRREDGIAARGGEGQGKAEGRDEVPETQMQMQIPESGFAGASQETLGDGWEHDNEQDDDTRQVADSQPTAAPASVSVSASTSTATATAAADEPAYWALDLDASSRSSSGVSASTSTLPIHTPASAASYLKRAFAAPKPPSRAPSKGSSKASSKGGSRGEDAEEADRPLRLLLGALELLYGSWSGTLDAAALESRAWSWYVAVRPDVKPGAAGWGGRGDVHLGRILELRREGGGAG